MERKRKTDYKIPTTFSNVSVVLQTLARWNGIWAPGEGVRLSKRVEPGASKKSLPAAPTSACPTEKGPDVGFQLQLEEHSCPPPSCSAPDISEAVAGSGYPRATWQENAGRSPASLWGGSGGNISPEEAEGQEGSKA